MTDTGTTAPEETAARAGATREVRRRRGLPGGRAVVGAFLVTLAAVGVFGAYLDATAEPTDRYAVALRDLPPGTRLSGTEFRYIAIDLPPELRGRAVLEIQADQVPGFTTVGPIREGDLLLSTLIVDDDGADDRFAMSFSVPDDRALAGTVAVGETVDVVATYPGSAGRAYTDVVVRGAEVLRVDQGDGQLGRATRTFLVALADLPAVQRLAHAIDTADVFVVRPGAGAGDELPPPFSPPGPAGASPPPSTPGP